MAGNREFDKRRFTELVHFIAWRTRDDDSFGRVKLAKVLFYTDLSVYADEGRALTGAVYQHWPYGPVPPALYDVEEELEAREMATVTIPAPGEVGTKKLRPFSEPRMTSFEAWDTRQRQVVERWIERIGRDAAWKASDESHLHPGWQLTAPYEEIPYHVAFMSRRKPADDDLRRGEELASQHGWP